MKKVISKLNVTAILLMFILSGINQTANAASPGSLDSSFGVSGFVTTNILGNDRLRDIAVQSDGKIVAVGSSGVVDFTIVRYTVNGVLDTTFSGDGIAFIDFGGNSDVATDIEIQSDGKILVAGIVNNLSSCGIARLNSNGTLDTAFDTDGKLILPASAMDIVGGMEFQTDGKIVLGGELLTSQTINSDVAIVRLNSNGTLDTSFGSNGRVNTNIEGSDESPEIKIQSDGKIVAVGSSGGTTTSTFAKSYVVRYNPNGSLDTTFSGDGIVLNDFSSGAEVWGGLSIDSISGTITTIGTNNASSERAMLIVRYSSSGNLDNSFSGDGILQIASPPNTGFDIVQQSDRKIVCLGSRFGNGVHLVRININGTIDSSFGNDGFVNLKDNGLNNTTGSRRLRLVGDRLIIGNDANSSSDFGIERINLSITPSQSGDFDGDGFGDIAVYRPSQGLWIIQRSSDNSIIFKQFGINGDIPIDGDFDGDGRNDFSIFRPSEGIWFVEKSSDGTNFARQFGTGADKPATGDYDNDGKADITFFRPATGEWFVLRSSDGFLSFFSFPFGQNGDIPIVKKGP